MNNPARRKRATLATWLAFGVGLPLGTLAVGWIMSFPKPPKDDGWFGMLYRYCEHPVEQAEIILFFMALGALLGKIVSTLAERRALRLEMLPPWSGHSQPVDSVAQLQENFLAQPDRAHRTLLGQRIAGVLDFLVSRRSANELDDQLRSLADVDANNMDQSYSLLRFITWAVPILGFLGTVLGITGAIGGVSPDQLENSLSQVTGGLATAFDTTALALGLTMVLMFFSFLVEQVESNALQQIDAYIDRELAHRFERISGDNHGVVDGLRKNAEILLQTSQQLVEQQAQIWNQTLAKAESAWTKTGSQQQNQLSAGLQNALSAWSQTGQKHQETFGVGLQQALTSWAQTGHEQQQRFSQGLQEALESTLARHQARLQEVEEKILARSQSLFDGLTHLAQVLTETSRQQQDALVQVAEKVGLHTGLLSKLQDNEVQLLHLQQSLHNNLAALTATGTFEEAVQSLTAAIHLMTSRVQPAPARIHKAA